MASQLMHGIGITGERRQALWGRPCRSVTGHEQQGLLQTVLEPNGATHVLSLAVGSMQGADKFKHSEPYFFLGVCSWGFGLALSTLPEPDTEPASLYSV